MSEPMYFVTLGTAAKRNDDKTFDAEVYLAFHSADGVVIKGTSQRTVKKRCATRDEAEQEARGWIEHNLFPVITALPKAKP